MAHRGAGRLKSRVQKAGQDPGRPRHQGHSQDHTSPSTAEPVRFSAVSACITRSRFKTLSERAPGHTGLGLYPDMVSGVGLRLFGFHS